MCSCWPFSKIQFLATAAQRLLPSSASASTDAPHPRDLLTALMLPGPTRAHWAMTLGQVVSSMELGKCRNCHPRLLPPHLNPASDLMGGLQHPAASPCPQVPLGTSLTLWTEAPARGQGQCVAFSASGGLCSTLTFCQIGCSLACDV